MIERMKLEDSYSKLERGNDRRSAGVKFLQGFFGIKKPKYDTYDIGEELAKSLFPEPVKAEKTKS